MVRMLDKVYDRGAAIQDRLKELERARIGRGWGDCFGHVLVATGRADVMLDPVLSDWDCVPLLPILEEAGGSFTDWHGHRTVRGKSGVSTNGKLRDEVHAVLHAGGEPEAGG